MKIFLDSANVNELRVILPSALVHHGGVVVSPTVAVRPAAERMPSPAAIQSALPSWYSRTLV